MKKTLQIRILRVLPLDVHLVAKKVLRVTPREKELEKCFLISFHIGCLLDMAVAVGVAAGVVELPLAYVCSNFYSNF